MVRFRFESDKAVTAVLYIAGKLIERRALKPQITADIHRIFKILYFADQKHLTRYGRSILGDYFIAMRDGPVPSQTYDLIKAVRGDSVFCTADNYKQFFDIVDGFIVSPKKEPDLDEFSESDLQCINESLQENQDLSFGTLKRKSHDAAYNKVTQNDEISFVAMAKTGGADDNMVSYIESVASNQCAHHRK